LKRKVVYEGTHSAKQYAEKQKNLVINWQAPQAVVKKGNLLMNIFINYKIYF
jgi:hypothetical protein